MAATVVHGYLISGPMQVLSNPKYRGSERCTSLVWHHGLYDYEVAAKIMTELLKKLLSLRHLTLISFVDPGGAKFPKCPVLEEVEMMNHGECNHSFWGTSLAQVTTVSFGSSTHWDADSTSVLSWFPVLQDLTLFTIGSDQVWNDIVPDPVSLPKCLWTLRVHGTCYQGFSTCLWPLPWKRCILR